MLIERTNFVFFQISKQFFKIFILNKSIFDKLKNKKNPIFQN
jgi:hypothetical protein